jgi:DNA-binding beta-propeller fold protein YncE
MKCKSFRYLNSVFILLVIFSLLGSAVLYGKGQAQKGRSLKIPEFPAGLIWFNTGETLSIQKLKGHVILLTFWTYGSINSLHTLPDLEYLQQKFKDKPFTVIGIHSGMFFNEQEDESVRAAVSRYNISVPVVVDKQHILWKRFRPRAWPTYLLVGSDGTALSVLTGEKKRKVLEKMIKGALKKGKKSKTLASAKYQFKQDIFNDTPLSFPSRITLDREKSILYISDSKHNRIIAAKLQTANSANILYRIGSGDKDLRNGDYNKAAFSNPQGLALHNGFLYVADADNHAIRAVDLTHGKIKTLIGDGKYGGFGKPNSPWDLIFHNGLLYIAMAGSHQIWTLDVKTKEIDLHAGNGYENFVDGSALGSCLAQPTSISIDLDQQRLYFLDSISSSLRYCSLSNGRIKTLIGEGLFKYGFADGVYAKASFQRPMGVYYSKQNIYIADSYNHALRKVDLKKGELTTLVRRGGTNGRDKNKTFIANKEFDMMPLNEPNDLLVFKNHVYIADTNNHCIRVYNLETKTLETLKLEQ